MDNKVGDKIRQLRLIKGLSQDNVAEEIGMSNGNFGKIERGEIDVNATHLIKIARVLEASVSDFFEDKHVLAEPKGTYDYASKDEVLVLRQAIQALSKQVEKLTEALPKKKAAAKKKYGKSNS